MASAIIPILTIALQAEPEFAALVKSLLALKNKYPQLTPDQIVSIVKETVAQADAGFDAVLQKIASDQAAPSQAAQSQAVPVAVTPAAPAPAPPPPPAG